MAGSQRGAYTSLDLLSAYHKEGDLEARARLIEDNLPLVRTLARRFAGRGETYDDLVQVATIGLIKAIDGFRAERGGDLSAYAVPTIVGELRRHARRGAWPFRDSEALRQAGRVPLAQPLDEDAVEAAEAEVGLKRGEDRALLTPGFRALTKRERRIVALRYYGDLSQERIGAQVGLSQVQISRVLDASLAKMRTALETS